MGRQGQRETPSLFLPSFIPGLSCVETAELTQEKSQMSPSAIMSHPAQVAPGAGANSHKFQCSPVLPEPPTHRFLCPQCSLSNPLGPLELAEHKPLRNANLGMVFRPPQRTVKKLWLCSYMSVAKLPLNQRQTLQIFLQAKSLLFSKSPSKDRKLQLLNLIHTE